MYFYDITHYTFRIYHAIVEKRYYSINDSSGKKKVNDCFSSGPIPLFPEICQLEKLIIQILFKEFGNSIFVNKNGSQAIETLTPSPKLILSY